MFLKSLKIKLISFWKSQNLLLQKKHKNHISCIQNEVGNKKKAKITIICKIIHTHTHTKTHKNRKGRPVVVEDYGPEPSCILIRDPTLGASRTRPRIRVSFHVFKLHSFIGSHGRIHVFLWVSGGKNEGGRGDKVCPGYCSNPILVLRLYRYARLISRESHTYRGGSSSGSIPGGFFGLPRPRE